MKDFGQSNSFCDVIGFVLPPVVGLGDLLVQNGHVCPDEFRASYMNNVRVLHQHGIVIEQAPDMPKVPLMPAQPQPQPKPPVMGPPA